MLLANMNKVVCQLTKKIFQNEILDLVDKVPFKTFYELVSKLQNILDHSIFHLPTIRMNYGCHNV